MLPSRSFCVLAEVLLVSALSTPNSTAPSYRQDLLDLHRELVEISSNSGLEEAVGKYLHNYLSDKGWAVKDIPVDPRSNTPENATRFNILAGAKGSDTLGAKVLLNTHFDTVPPHIAYSIEEGEITGDTQISGRGSVDAKASLAAMVIALTELVEAGEVSPKDVGLAFVVGEEVGGEGIKALGQYWTENTPSFNAIIFGEPTEGKLACGHKGGMTCTLNAYGVAGHSGYPELGRSATAILIKALDKILEADLGSSVLFGNTTVNVGQLEGIAVNNVIADHALAGFGVRVAVGPQSEGATVVKEKIEGILDEVDLENLLLSCNQGYGPVETNCDVEGFETDVMKYGTDIPKLELDRKFEKYLYGPGTIFVAHSVNENVTVGALEEAVESYKKLVLNALDR
ncbi:unnamed protein product [Clonostachys chloroleuca]|uniref:Peptidase M20 dimerisation domain-containing protein n=1 Tax=Clonostachys chloroleuca TaxID=1926264 RepID=A0AA35M946_9HYPO|nr:unnamed protein product [Clonostachys chloroleuca]